MAQTAVPTRERLRQAQGAFEIGGDRRSGRIFRMMDTPLEQLFADGRITNLDYDTLCRLRMHWTLGQLGGAPRAIDYDRINVHVASEQNGSERELFHREMFELGWRNLAMLERGVIGAVVLQETALAIAGTMLGYASPYRARNAALDLIRSGAAALANSYSKFRI